MTPAVALGALSAGSSDGAAEECPADTIRIVGWWSSPYTQKMLAALRFYRRSHRFLNPQSLLLPGLAMPHGPALAPICYFGEEPMTDSTFIIGRLEQEGVGSRSLLPLDPALRFLSKLVEDFADEWCTKMMFHFRWDLPADQQKAGRFLVMTIDPAMPDPAAEAIAARLRERQVARLELVGSNAVTKPAIERDFERLVDLLDQHLASGAPFLFGGRPSQADFALFGQFTQLWRVDNRSRALLESRSLRVAGWVAFMTDLSGLAVSDSAWHTELSPTARELVREVGRHYAPFMVANARALSSGVARVECTMQDGMTWSQPAFPYQAKCLRWLQEDYGALAPEARATVDAVLAGSGAEVLFANLQSRL